MHERIGKLQYLQFGLDEKNMEKTWTDLALMFSKELICSFDQVPGVPAVNFRILGAGGAAAGRGMEEDGFEERNQAFRDFLARDFGSKRFPAMRWGTSFFPSPSGWSALAVKKKGWDCSSVSLCFSAER